MLSTLEVDGTAKIDGPDGIETMVVINEDIIRDVLSVPKENISLLTKNTQTETNETFMLLRHADYTYKDLIRIEQISRCGTLFLFVFFFFFFLSFETCFGSATPNRFSLV